MLLLVDERKMRELLKDTVIDLMKDKKELLHKIIVESIEDISFADAITKGRKNKFVEEKRILEILKK